MKNDMQCSTLNYWIGDLYQVLNDHGEIDDGANGTFTLAATAADQGDYMQLHAMHRSLQENDSLWATSLHNLIGYHIVSVDVTGLSDILEMCYALAPSALSGQLMVMVQASLADPTMVVTRDTDVEMLMLRAVTDILQNT